MKNNTKEFKPEKHLIDIKGKKYLPVAARLIWFRQDHPDYSIETEIVERISGGAILKATIKNKEQVLSTAHKMETKEGFADYLEKAETGAIGRALALIGYGTQFAPELDEGNRLADAPQGKSAMGEKAQRSSDRKATPKQLGAIELIYTKQGIKVDDLYKRYEAEYGKPLTDLTVQEASDIIGNKVVELFDGQGDIQDDNPTPAGMVDKAKAEPEPADEEINPEDLNF